MLVILAVLCDPCETQRRPAFVIGSGRIPTEKDARWLDLLAWELWFALGGTFVGKGGDLSVCLLTCVRRDEDVAKFVRDTGMTLWYGIAVGDINSKTFCGSVTLHALMQRPSSTTEAGVSGLDAIEAEESLLLICDSDVVLPLLPSFFVGRRGKCFPLRLVHELPAIGLVSFSSSLTLALP
jgi:hypothetical protein